MSKDSLSFSGPGSCSPHLPQEPSPRLPRPGEIVRCRKREWVLLPSADDTVYRLRPLAGSEDDAVLVHKQISQILGFDFPEERVTPAHFPPPSADHLGDATSCRLLWEAARLTLREGAAPFRSLGRVSIRPRVYQLVPLLMALRLDPVRLFIADDVGVGKTIEALLVARELWDRHEIRSLAVLCPPHLCEQWEFELATKANLPPVIIRSGTISTLERRLPPGKSVYQHYPIQVISIDWVKSDVNRFQFLQFCPDLVIVDEVHGAAAGNSSGQQARHALLRDIARKKNQHLILLTATPHSGKPEAFRSLLSLLDEAFEAWDVSNLDEAKRIVLARHFVQRTRKDIAASWEDSPVFPERAWEDATYQLTPSYRLLFEKTFRFCEQLVEAAKKLEKQKQRFHHWAALGLLRCVMSSPAAAIAAVQSRLEDGKNNRRAPQETELQLDAQVFEATDQLAVDEVPSSLPEAAEEALPLAFRKSLKELAQLAAQLQEPGQDGKLEKCAEVLRSLLSQGFQPIVWCRYVATAEYVAKELERRTLSWGLGEVQVLAITGRMGDEERRAKLAELDRHRPRILVATDCLSEGINLQELFTAVLHYDLPWNPNRLEQREGRVDRYGQTAKVVKAIRLYGADNPVDGAVLRVLIRKADQIRKTLGTHVPIPEETEALLQAMFEALFLRARKSQQQHLFEDHQVEEFHALWDRLHLQEATNRSRFAQRAIKAEEVRRELEATDQVLGDPEAVCRFVRDSCQRLGLSLKEDGKTKEVFHLPLEETVVRNLPEAIRRVLPTPKRAGKAAPTWPVTFVSPSPQGAEYLGRNHPFVASLAAFLLETALEGGATLTADGFPLVARCGAIRTRAVDRLTTLLLLRARYLMNLPPKSQDHDQGTSLLAEEVVVTGFRHAGPRELSWLSPEQALRLLTDATPTANLSQEEKVELVQGELALVAPTAGASPLPEAAEYVARQLEALIGSRATALEESHKNLRRAAGERLRGLKLEPLTPDLLGLLVLQPEVRL